MLSCRKQCFADFVSRSSVYPHARHTNILSERGDVLILHDYELPSRNDIMVYLVCLRHPLVGINSEQKAALPNSTDQENVYSVTSSENSYAMSFESASWFFFSLYDM